MSLRVPVTVVTALVAAAVCGCGGVAVPTKESAPVKVTEGIDKKGKKGKMVEASFEETK